jgi:transcriptional regulator with XRE-family HTH domain
MAIPLDEYLAKLPNERRDEIERRAETLIAEEATLRQLRTARARSQEELARALGEKHATVSKPERRTDMDFSTLRGLIEAMGGTLEIVARFPGQPPVLISQFEALDREEPPG